MFSTLPAGSATAPAACAYTPVEFAPVATIVDAPCSASTLPVPELPSARAPVRPTLTELSVNVMRPPFWATAP